MSSRLSAISGAESRRFHRNVPRSPRWEAPEGVSTTRRGVNGTLSGYRRGLKCRGPPKTGWDRSAREVGGAPTPPGVPIVATTALGVTVRRRLAPGTTATATATATAFPLTAPPDMPATRTGAGHPHRHQPSTPAPATRTGAGHRR